MQPSHAADKLIFNFGYLLEGSAGISAPIEIDYPSIKLDDAVFKPLIGSFRASRTTQGIYIKGSLQTDVSNECARCMDTFLNPITIQLDDHFYLRQVAPDGEFVIADDGELDLGPLVRELGLLSHSSQPVCRVDCEGLCQSCGINLNHETCDCDDEELDPRMAVLRQLLQEEQKNESS